MYIGDITPKIVYSENYTLYSDTIECRYTWNINNRICYSRVLYTREYYEKYIK
jgi:hypothetical protein